MFIKTDVTKCCDLFVGQVFVKNVLNVMRSEILMSVIIITVFWYVTTRSPLEFAEVSQEETTSIFKVTVCPEDVGIVFLTNFYKSYQLIWPRITSKKL
jgi:hypothetical protein